MFARQKKCRSYDLYQTKEALSQLETAEYKGKESLGTQAKENILYLVHEGKLTSDQFAKLNLKQANAFGFVVTYYYSIGKLTLEQVCDLAENPRDLFFPCPFDIGQCCAEIQTIGRQALEIAEKPESKIPPHERERYYGTIGSLGFLFASMMKNKIQDKQEESKTLSLS